MYLIIPAADVDPVTLKPTTDANVRFSLDGNLSGLTNGTTLRSYYLGSASVSPEFTPKGAPGQMAAPTLTGGTESASLTLAAAPNDGGYPITGYAYEIDEATGDFSTPVATGTQAPADLGTAIAISPLVAEDYKARSWAINEKGSGAPSGASPAATVNSANIGTAKDWAEYRARVKRLSEPGETGHDTSLTLQKVSVVSHPNITYNSTNHTATINTDGTEANPALIEGIDFEGAYTSVINSNVIIRNCKWDLADTTYRPAGLLKVTSNDFNVLVEYCTFSGARGRDVLGDLFSLHGAEAATKGGSTFPDNVTLRRCRFQNVSQDVLKTRMGDNTIFEENWFEGLNQHPPGTRRYDATVTYALGDWVIYKFHVYQSLADSNLGNAPSGNDTDNTWWDFTHKVPHSDGTQYVYGEDLIFRGNLMDATGTNAAGEDKLNAFLRIANENNGSDKYYGPQKYLGNVFRKDQNGYNFDQPVDAIQYYRQTGGTWVGHYFEGNEIFANRDIFATNLSNGDGQYIRWGKANVSDTGVALGLQSPEMIDWAGTEVPIFAKGGGGHGPSNLTTTVHKPMKDDGSAVSTVTLYMSAGKNFIVTYSSGGNQKSLKVDGVLATKHGEHSIASSTNRRVAIWEISQPAGGDAALELTTASTNGEPWAAVWSVKEAGAVTFFGVDNDAIADLSVSLNVAAGDEVFAAATTLSGEFVNWTGLTETGEDLFFTSRVASIANEPILAANTAYSITASKVGTAARHNSLVGVIVHPPV